MANESRTKASDTSSPVAARQGVTMPQLLNQVRQKTGMTPLKASAILDRAAHNHAAYLDRHSGKSGWRLRDAHKERRGKSGFSGETPAKRAQATGYLYQRVLENVSIGNTDTADSIEGLMSGIYHRFAFLDFAIDEVGYAQVGDSFVYKLGRAEMNGVCHTPPPQALLEKPFDCLGTPVTGSYWKMLCESMPSEAFYEKPFGVRCPNGQLLNNSFMQSVCENPPEGSLLEESGQYFTLCKPPRKIRADWLEQVCQSDSEHIRYAGNGAYYRICEAPRKVHANWLQMACESLPAWALYSDSGYYRKPCHSDLKLRQEFIDDKNRQRYQQNPRYVLWPPANGSGLPVVFYDETPDPVPDLDVSGYPLSLQFNPGLVTQVSIESFQLEANINGNPVTVDAISQVDAVTDPNETLDALQFAWFPIEPLRWNTRYRMHLELLVDGVKETISWQFRTAELPDNAIELKPQQSIVKIKAGSWTTLYLPPSRRLSRPFSKVSARWRKPAEVRFEPLTPNLIKLFIRNNFCLPVELSLPNGRQLTLKTCQGR